MRRRFALAVFAVLVVAGAHEWVHAAPAPGGVVSRIRNTGRLTLGYRADARPFSYANESGMPAGYSVALCQKVADAAKHDLGLPALKIDWIPVAFEQRFGALRLGEIDLMCGADTVTLARRAEADFSIPIFPGGIGALLRSDSSPRLRDVLSGRGQPFHPVWRANATQLLQSRDFTVITGTTAQTWLSKRMSDLDVVARVAPVNSYNEGIQRVLNRRSDVLFGDRAILLDAAKRQSGARDLVVLDRLFSYEPLALALAPGDDEFRLLVDRALSRFYRSAEFATVYTNSFPEPDETTLTFFRWNALPE
jgi:ABC-type amino acid transport substrate-binding protein